MNVLRRICLVAWDRDVTAGISLHIENHYTYTLTAQHPVVIYQHQRRLSNQMISPRRYLWPIIISQPLWITMKDPGTLMRVNHT